MSSPNDAPPPYPGPTPFALPSYDESTAVDDTVDSLRLPTYQPRTNQRFHPYLRVNNRPRNLFSGYGNTIYDESYIPLDVSLLVSHSFPALASSVVANVPTAPTTPALLPSVNPALPLPVPNTEVGPEEQHRRGILRLLHLIPEFERAVREALAAAQCQKCCVDTTDTDKSTMNQPD